jgi:hypothetical protein
MPRAPSGGQRRRCHPPQYAHNVAAPWTQHFDFYVAVEDGRPVSVVVDMAAIEHVPVASHPTVLLVRVPMKNPNPNGLRSDAEFDAMSTVEDVLVNALESNTSAIYWGRQIHRGVTDFMFQLEDEPGPALFERLRPFLSVPGYTVQPKLRMDPEWELYAGQYPSTYHEHTMTNRALQTQLREMGDRLTKRRVIDHVALFPEPGSADIAAQTLRRRRFRINELEGPDEAGAWVLHFQRKEACDGDRPDAFTAEILEAIEPNDGVYDGWGCAVRN